MKSEIKGMYIRSFEFLKLIILTINNVFNELGSFLIDLRKGENWVKIELHLKIQPKMLGMSGKLFTEEKSTSIRTRLDNELRKKVIWMHKLTTEAGNNKWNKAVSTVTPNKKFNMEYIWDQEWQSEVDDNNRKAMIEDPSYISPKWHWEE